jgi:hypothetical protein
VDDVLQAAVRCPDAVDTPGEGVVDDEDPAVDLGERVGDLRDAPPDVDRDDDAAGPQRRGEELVVAVGVQPAQTVAISSGRCWTWRCSPWVRYTATSRSGEVRIVAPSAPASPGADGPGAAPG